MRMIGGDEQAEKTVQLVMRTKKKERREWKVKMKEDGWRRK